MGRQVLRYSALLIGIYLFVAYASGSGTVIEAASAGAQNTIKAFQGR